MRNLLNFLSISPAVRRLAPWSWTRTAAPWSRRISTPMSAPAWPRCWRAAEPDFDLGPHHGRPARRGNLVPAALVRPRQRGPAHARGMPAAERPRRGRDRQGRCGTAVPGRPLSGVRPAHHAAAPRRTAARGGGVEAEALTIRRCRGRPLRDIARRCVRGATHRKCNASKMQCIVDATRRRRNASKMFSG